MIDVQTYLKNNHIILKLFYKNIFYKIIFNLLKQFQELRKQKYFEKFFMPYLEAYRLEYIPHISINFIELFKYTLGFFTYPDSLSDLKKYLMFIDTIKENIKNEIQRSKIYLIFIAFIHLLKNFPDIQKKYYTVTQACDLIDLIISFLHIKELNYNDFEKNNLGYYFLKYNPEEIKLIFEKNKFIFLI